MLGLQKNKKHRIIADMPVISNGKQIGITTGYSEYEDNKLLTNIIGPDGNEFQVEIKDEIVNLSYAFLPSNYYTCK